MTSVCCIYDVSSKYDRFDSPHYRSPIVLKKLLDLREGEDEVNAIARGCASVQESWGNDYQVKIHTRSD